MNIVSKNFTGKNYRQNLSNYLINVLKKNNSKKLILTGGKTSKLIYKIFLKKIINLNTKIDIFLTDERCLKIGNKNLNEKFFLNKFKNSKINFFPILSDKNFLVSANKYNKILPNHPSIILLSIGSDGHIASIFKNSKALKTKKKIIYEKKKYKKFERISISLNYLKSKKNIFLLCKGRKRLNMFLKLVKKKEEILNSLYVVNSKFKLLII